MYDGAACAHCQRVAQENRSPRLAAAHFAVFVAVFIAAEILFRFVGFSLPSGGAPRGRAGRREEGGGAARTTTLSKFCMSLLRLSAVVLLVLTVSRSLCVSFSLCLYLSLSPHSLSLSSSLCVCCHSCCCSPSLCTTPLFIVPTPCLLLRVIKNFLPSATLPLPPLSNPCDAALARFHFHCEC